MRKQVINIANIQYWWGDKYYFLDSILFCFAKILLFVFCLNTGDYIVYDTKLEKKLELPPLHEGPVLQLQTDDNLVYLRYLNKKKDEEIGIWTPINYKNLFSRSTKHRSHKHVMAVRSEKLKVVKAGNMYIKHSLKEKQKKRYFQLYDTLLVEFKSSKVLFCLF